MAETMPYDGGRGGRTLAPVTEEDGSRSRATAFEETLPSAPSGDALDVGSKVGRYEVIDRVGAGGMGVVYKAYDPELHREVALKLLKAGPSGAGQANSKRRKRLLREARAMAQLSHPNVIPVYDVGVYGTGLYVAMEFVQGSNAREWLKAERPPWRRTLGVFRAAGRGLAAAHTAGLVHRDFKPANVLVGDDGRVRVLDFGLARAVVDEHESEVSADAPAPPPELDGGWSETLTADGTILGTPVYMAPEQYSGKPADARSDQYSFCIALYEALYGKLPFAIGSIKEQAHAKYRGEIADEPEGSPVPARLYHVLRKGLATKPEDRFASMPDLLRELRTVQEDEAVLPRSRGWLAVGGVLAVAVGSVMIGAWARPEVAAAGARCAAASEVLAQTWGEGPREQVRQAFVTSRVTGAEERFRELEGPLDARAEAWGQRYDAVCNVAAGDAAAERLRAARLACLERQRVDLASFVASLHEPTAVVVQYAASGARGLPGLEECEDEASRIAAEPERLEREAPLYERVGKARALRTTGRGDAARAELDETIEQASAQGLRAVSGRARLERAQLHRGTRQLGEAEQDLRAAYFDFVADRDARLAATAAIGVVDLLAVQGRRAEAEAWAEHARAQVAAMGDADGLEAALQQALAQLASASVPRGG